MGNARIQGVVLRYQPGPRIYLGATALVQGLVQDRNPGLAVADAQAQVSHHRETLRTTGEAVFQMDVKHLLRVRCLDPHREIYAMGGDERLTEQLDPHRVLRSIDILIRSNPQCAGGRFIYPLEQIIPSVRQSIERQAGLSAWNRFFIEPGRVGEALGRSSRFLCRSEFAFAKGGVLGFSSDDDGATHRPGYDRVFDPRNAAQLTYHVSAPADAIAVGLGDLADPLETFPHALCIRLSKRPDKSRYNPGGYMLPESGSGSLLDLARDMQGRLQKALL